MSIPKAKHSKKLVIDASVGRAAGGPEATAPLSIHCRDFLQAVLIICHRAVLPRPLLDEWKKHRSSFARTWLTAMFSRNKVQLQPVSPDPALQDRLEKTTRSPGELEALQKDMHLILAALANDRAVISLDNKMREILRSIGLKQRVLQGLLWVHPGEVGEDALSWLKDSCPSKKEWSLSPKPDES